MYGLAPTRPLIFTLTTACMAQPKDGMRSPDAGQKPPSLAFPPQTKHLHEEVRFSDRRDGTGFFRCGGDETGDRQASGADAARSTAHRKIHGIPFRNGVWKAKARSADDRSVDLRIDPRTSYVLSDRQVAHLSAADIRAQLSMQAMQGYTLVHDRDFKDGAGIARADGPAGKRVGLQLDPDTDRGIDSNRHGRVGKKFARSTASCCDAGGRFLGNRRVRRMGRTRRAML